MRKINQTFQTTSGETRVYDPDTYGNLTIMDACTAGHLTDWVDANKKFITKTQMIKLMMILESRSYDETNYAENIDYIRQVRYALEGVEKKMNSEKFEGVYLTPKEKEVVDYLIPDDNIGWFGDGWYWTEDMRVSNLSQEALGGILSSLVKKGIVVCRDQMTILKCKLDELVGTDEEEEDQ